MKNNGTSFAFTAKRKKGPEKKSILGKIRFVFPFSRKSKRIKQLESDLQQQNLTIRQLQSQINRMKEQQKETNAKIFINNAPQKTSKSSIALSMSKLDVSKIGVRKSATHSKLHTYPLSKSPIAENAHNTLNSWFDGPKKMPGLFSPPKVESNSSYSISILL